MSDLPGNPDATADPSAESVRRRILDSYRQAWESALRDGTPPPDLASYLATAPAGEGETIRDELARIERSFRAALSQRFAAPGGDAPTVDHSSGANGGPAGGTVGWQPARTDAPGDAAEEPGTADYRPDPAATTDHQPPRKRSALPQSVAGYEILGRLGKGAMGVVYKARQPGLNRLVALKMILAGDHADENDLRRFRAEAEAVARLRHPNIVQVYEVGEEQGHPFFSLEYMNGGPLSKKLAARPLVPRQAAELTAVLAAAMEYAHRQGVVHRDLKPANILLAAEGDAETPEATEVTAAVDPDGPVSFAGVALKIADFGLAKRLEESGQTRSDAVLGTPSYMAPEQAAGQSKQVGPLADVYALGAILHEMLTGRVPFRGASVLDTLHQVRHQEAVPPRQLQPKVPRDLEVICLKCLQKDPRKRYAGAGELAADLRRFLAGEPILARPVSAPERFWRWCQRNPRVAGLSGTVFGLIVTVAVVASVLSVQLSSALSASIANEKEARDKTKEAERNLKLAGANLELAKEQQSQQIERLLVMIENLHKELQPRPGQKLGPEETAVREKVLRAARETITDTARDFEKYRITQFARLKAHARLGDLFRKFGESGEAEGQYQTGYELIRQVVEADPTMDQARGNMAVTLRLLGDVTMERSGDAVRARDYYRQALATQEGIRDRPGNAFYTPEQHVELIAKCAYPLGNVCVLLGDPAAAEACFAKVLTHRLALARAKPGKASESYLAEAYYLLGDACGRQGKAGEAQEHLIESLKLCVKLAREHPDVSFGVDMALVSSAYGDALARAGKGGDALARHQRFLRDVEGAIAEQPAVPRHKEVGAAIYAKVGHLLTSEGRLQEAADAYRRSAQLWRELAGLDPRNPKYQARLLEARAGADDPWEVAAAARQLAGRWPAHTEVQAHLARCFAGCVRRLAAAGQLPPATTPPAAGPPGGAVAAAVAMAAREQLAADAVAALRRASAAAYTSAVDLGTDPGLQPLRDHPGFGQLLAGIRRNHAVAAAGGGTGP